MIQTNKVLKNDLKIYVHLTGSGRRNTKSVWQTAKHEEEQESITSYEAINQFILSVQTWFQSSTAVK